MYEGRVVALIATGHVALDSQLCPIAALRICQVITVLCCIKDAWSINAQISHLLQREVLCFYSTRSGLRYLHQSHTCVLACTP